MGTLTGNVALVTGGSRGIGRAICLGLAAEGALVAVHYAEDDAAAKEVVTDIEQAGGSALPVRGRFGDDGDVDTVISALEAGLRERLGRPRLDILVNNAAISESAGGIDGETPEAFDRLFAVNVRAPFFLIQRALPLMSAGGRIINIGSGATRIALPGELAYAMTKAAMENLTRNAANDLGARGITINMVSPGPTRTERMAAFLDHPQAQAAVAANQAIERVGTPQDVADVVTFLASDASGWLTANVLDATGGSYLGPKRLG
ncbi:SDR family NAD(P)-dependent oxidoreductase [Xylanimonas ulmi]|uniref:NAD(P)-dependent dehydrogenase (Short-subunit alcohol dehydrogenase family) n=1 Tax=Xylanimonas ulmi TaxID=228973 RepID=A0A4Q7M4H2_9MICO|nr:SDR family oxidoreductase [Xylanibacterium ulmi]RZS62271.1 NAD(P)-dependent dehydrogenase (short-subunit alcohol dehydrogenase family) [Xylanibacterium ulmi]